MPIATSLDLLADTHEQQTKLSKIPLSNGTNRQESTIIPPVVPLKPRLRSKSTRTCRVIDFEQITNCSSMKQHTLTNFENEKWLAMASSNEYILVGGGCSSTLRLFDLQGNELRSIDIKTFAAFDLAWSNLLNCFLISGYDSLQTYNVEKDQLTQVDNLNLVNKKDTYFWSIACHKFVEEFQYKRKTKDVFHQTFFVFSSDLFVVLSDGLESVWRLSLPTFERTQTLSGSDIREDNTDDRISCIRTNGYSIGMTLRQQRTNQWRIDLFDYMTMTRTHRGLTIGYGIGGFNFTERCMLTALNDHQWLVVGGYKVQPNALTLLDDRTGEIKQIERQTNQQQEFISNLSSNEINKQHSINMIVMNNQTGQRQIHVLQV